MIPLDHQAPITNRRGQRQQAQQAGMFHPRRGACLLKQAGVEAHDLLRRVVRRGRQRQSHRQGVRGIKSKIDLLQLPEAACQQHGTRQQNDGHGGLGDHEGAAEALTMTAGGRTLRAILQRVGQVHLGSSERRGQRKQEQRHDRDAE